MPLLGTKARQIQDISKVFSCKQVSCLCKSVFSFDENFNFSSGIKRKENIGNKNFFKVSKIFFKDK